MMKNNILLIFLCVFLSGCVSKEMLVRPGESSKLHTLSGVYADVFVDENEFDSPVITLSSSVEDSLQVATYFDNVEVEKILIARGLNGMILSFSGDASNPENMSVIAVQGIKGNREKTEYKLVAVENKR